MESITVAPGGIPLFEIKGKHLVIAFGLGFLTGICWVHYSKNKKLF
jgi:hypothetical protein